MKSRLLCLKKRMSLKKKFLLSSKYQTLKIFQIKETYNALSKLGIDKTRFVSIKNKKLFMSFLRKKQFGC